MQAYEQFSQQHGLPLWRLEMQLAQIAMLLDAQRRPGADLALRDYLIRPAAPATEQPATPAEPDTVTEAQADAMAEAIGFKPRRRRTPPTNTATP